MSLLENSPGRAVPTDPTTLCRDALVAELDVLRALIRGEDPTAAEAAAHEAVARLDGPGPLDLLTVDLGLSDAERSILLLAAGQEFVGAVREELRAATGVPYLTFGAALHLLPGAHWSALAPDGPLRHWDLVVLDDPRSPAYSPLTADERIVHHLVGAGSLDERLKHLARWAPAPVPLPAVLAEAAHRVALGWQEHGTVLVQAGQPDDGRAVAVSAAAWTGAVLREVAGADLPTDPADLHHLMHLLDRETRLDACAWLVTLDDVPLDVAARILRACSEARGGFALLADVRSDLALRTRELPVVTVPRLDVPARVELLDAALRWAGAPPADVPLVAGVFDLSVAQAYTAAQDVAAGASLWPASRVRSRVEAGGAARRVEPRAGWDDLVLPQGQMEQLAALVAAVRHRTLVLDTWGYAQRTMRGLGTTALFAGASGTGKTLAAEVVAHELDLDLLYVDLSQVVSKYIGETEKNLGAVFDAAERGSAVLLFDEADTLFGKRSEVKDSHDRYANLEVGYLLQRMEEFRGLAILTTNARAALDQAFVRRLHAVVPFPYPDVDARARLWRIAFPPQTPTDDLDIDALAKVDVPGGAIAAAALTAGYLAAADGGPVTTAHVRSALTWELAKSGRTVAGR